MTDVELYIFDLADGSDLTYRVTSAAADIDSDGDTYTAAPIDRSVVEDTATGDVEFGSCEVTIDNLDGATDLAREWDGAGPTGEVTVQILSGDATDLDGTVEQEFSGVVSGLSRSGKTLTLNCEPRKIDTGKQGPRGQYSQRCRWSVYSEGCGVDKSEHTDVVGFEELSFSELQRQVQIEISEEYPEDYYLNGMIETLLPGPGGLPRQFVTRRIVDQEGPVDLGGGAFEYTITIQYWIRGLEEIEILNIIAGCDQSPETCQNRFDNYQRFGGFPTLSLMDDSPFGQGWRTFGGD